MTDILGPFVAIGFVYVVLWYAWYFIVDAIRSLRP